MTERTVQNDLLSSIISDIKSYSGKDPLLPWIRGMKQIKESLPASVIAEKLPRFLQKCAQEFQSDRRYKNDLRFLRVWLQLMDYVEDPRQLLRSMERNDIGTKRSLYYQAHALYYEKLKKFEEAEKMYHLGVQNLAETVDELHKSYEQFLQRMERHKNKKSRHQEGRSGKRPLSARVTEGNKENVCSSEVRSKKILDGNSQQLIILRESNYVGVAENANKPEVGSAVSMKKEHLQLTGPAVISKPQPSGKTKSDGPNKLYGDDSVVVKFVDTTIGGNSETEDACHHGLLDPTTNMKEAMNAINSMFREPLEIPPVGRSHRSQRKSINGINIFVDQNLEKEISSTNQKQEMDIPIMQDTRAESCQQQFHIFVDDEESGDADTTDEDDDSDQSETQNLAGGSCASASNLKAFVFPCPKDDEPHEISDNIDEQSSGKMKLREDTIVHRFVGSTILDEPKVENVCHHGLVDPTVNLKEAMDDINNMFGKPMEFVRARRRHIDKEPVKKHDTGGFSILPDDDLEDQRSQPPPMSCGTGNSDLFEPTLCTKEAIDEINKMFGMPLDF